MNLAFLIDFAIVSAIGAVAASWLCVLGLVTVSLGMAEDSKIDKSRRHSLDNDMLLLAILLGIGFFVSGSWFLALKNSIQPDSIRILAGVSSLVLGMIVALNYSRFLNRFYLQRAQESLFAGSIRDAQEDLSEVIRSSSQLKEKALYYQAACFCRLGEFQRAERSLEEMGLDRNQAVDGIQKLAKVYPAMTEAEINSKIMPQLDDNQKAPIAIIAPPAIQPAIESRADSHPGAEFNFDYKNLRNAKPRTNYQESGRFSIPRLSICSLLGSIACVIIGGVYSLGVILSPSVKLNFVFVFLAGCAVGLVTLCVSRFGHVRNKSVNYGIAATLSMVALYSAWSTDLLYSLNRSVNADGLNVVAWVTPTPFALFNWGQWLFENGSWSFSEGGAPVTGYFLLCVWIGETICFMSCAIGVTYDRTRNAIYCETCNCWMKFESDRVKLPTKANDTAIRDIKNGDLKAIMKMSIDREQRSHLTMRLCLCPKCEENRVLEINEHTKQNVDGNVVAVETRIAGPLPISGDEEMELRALAFQLMELNEELSSARYAGYESNLASQNS